MLLCPLFTGDFQIITILCPITSQEGAWSRFWWLTQCCSVGTRVMTFSTISHMDPWTWIKLTTRWPGSLRAWKTAGTPDLITPDLITPDLITPDLITPAHHAHYLFLLCLWTSKWLVTEWCLQLGTIFNSQHLVYWLFWYQYLWFDEIPCIYFNFYPSPVDWSVKLEFLLSCSLKSNELMRFI